jgi:hypothetical protein
VTTNLKIPTVHLNGTSREELLGQISNAMHAVREARDALMKATPNARDFYVQGDGAFKAAIAQHYLRLDALNGVLGELEAIGVAISDQ